MSQHFWWGTFYKDVKQFVGACAACAVSKRGLRTYKAEMQRATLATRLGDIFHIDVMGPLEEDDGYKYVKAGVDAFSGYIWLFTIKDQKAEILTKCLINNKRHGNF